MKKRFERSDRLFSLCGLNCGLCPMNIRGKCGGCFSESPCYPGCPIAPCSVRHGSVEYCFQCEQYPCRRYDGIDLHDSLISHRNQKKDLLKAKQLGIEAYLNEQKEKKALLDQLLSGYDDGHKDVFFCLAVNMLEVGTLLEVLQEAETETQNMSRKEKAAYMQHCLSRRAEELGIPLTLRR